MSSNLSIDINADVGEGIGNEALLMPYLTSCNIACGGHAGDFETMTKVVKLAKSHHVKIGAHPSFPDRLNFGRKEMKMSSDALFFSLKYQIEVLFKVLNSEKTTMHHVKPHGALYNLAAKNEKIAKVVLDVIESFPQQLKLYAPYKSTIAKLAKERKIDVVFEGFADRNYNQDLSLVSRQKPNALIIEKEEVFEHVHRMISKQKIKTISGIKVALFANTICIHGDTKNAIEILKYLHVKLAKNNIKIT